MSGLRNYGSICSLFGFFIGYRRINPLSHFQSIWPSNLSWMLLFSCRYLFSKRGPGSFYLRRTLLPDRKEGSLCTPCDSKCATCINSRRQCLECAQGWLKLGWKCVKNETVKFNFTLQIPPVVAQSTAGQNVTSTNLSTYISQLKASLLTSILPQ